MRKKIKISGSKSLIADIISQVEAINREEENQIKFLGRNDFSMIGMQYHTVHDNTSGSSNIDLIIEAENPMLFYKLGLYTASIIKKILK